MRKNIVAGNWKMNCTLEETEKLLANLKTKAEGKYEHVELMVAPPYVNLPAAVEALKGSAIKVSAQNMHQEESGAFTGEIAPEMLKSIGVETVILGHSERRKYFGENHDILRQKVETALKHDFTIIFCIGESLEDRESDKHFSVVETQLRDSILEIAKEAWKNVVLAYEPVWAIGTGKTASANQAQEMHEQIREIIANTYDQATADEVSILYGGSVKPKNAAEIFAKEDVDGGLIGGASLNADDFLAIADGFQ